MLSQIKKEKERIINHKPKNWHVKGLVYTIRSAVQADASELSRVRVQIDGETENFAREKTEMILWADASGIKK